MRFFSTAVLASIALVACGTFGTDDPTPPAPVMPATPDGGDVAEGGAEGGDAGAAAGCSVLYVSPDGSDTDDGCSAAKAKKTIGAAIARVKGENLTGREIHVCAGKYTESLTVDVPLSLRGGYSCNKFERNAAFGLTGFNADGTAAGFDTTSVTQIVSPEDAPYTVRVVGVGVVASSLIDGLAVSAPSVISGGDRAPNAAILIADGAAPVIENCDVQGGSHAAVSQAGASSIAIAVRRDASPTLRKNRINGGHGTGGGLGSIGIAVYDASASISGNQIDGGDGTGAAIGSLGIQVADSKQAVIVEQNHVFGSGHGPGTVASIGIYFLASTGPAATIRGNRLHPRTAHCDSGGCFAFGIIAEQTPYDIDGNIIEMGTLDGSGPYIRTALNLRAVHGTRVVNNVVHGGADQPTGSSNTDVAIGIADRGDGMAASQTGDSLLVAHNTVFPGSPHAGQSIAFDAFGTTHVSLLDNLFLIPIVGGTSNVFPIGLHVSNCTNTTSLQIFSSVSNNAFVGDGLLARINTDCANRDSVYNDETVPAQLAAEAIFPLRVGNVAIRTKCVGDATTCIIDSGCAVNCPALVIPGFSAAPAFGSELVLGAGLGLAASAPCLLTAGGASLDPAADILGTPRTPSPTPGAYETDRTCP
jgi:hypothetical protein